jgi:hypothetical protein
MRFTKKPRKGTAALPGRFFTNFRATIPVLDPLSSWNRYYLPFAVHFDTWVGTAKQF